MQTIEEYIARRKREDKLEEFDINARNDNTRICVNYVFEYFNNYLNITEAEEKTALKDERLDKYRNQLRAYDTEIIDWLVQIYSDHGKYVENQVDHILRKEEFFYLYNSDSELRSLSYDCYAKLIKKLPFLKDQTEMLFRLIKNYRYINKQPPDTSCEICIPVDEWIQETWVKHKVNLWSFVYRWLRNFSDNVGLWPITHRKKSQDFDDEYDYKQKSNLFNLDSLYRRMPKKPYTKGRKQEFEIIMMYAWIHSIEGDESYWGEYLNKTLPFLKKV